MVVIWVMGHDLVLYGILHRSMVYYDDHRMHACKSDFRARPVCVLLVHALSCLRKHYRTENHRILQLYLGRP